MMAPINVVQICPLRGTFYGTVQILRRYTQLRGIPSDGMFLTYMDQQKPDELFEQDVLTTGLRKFPALAFLPDMFVRYIHHEHPSLRFSLVLEKNDACGGCTAMTCLDFMIGKGKFAGILI